MKVIPLSKTGKHAIVDDADFDYLSQFTWRFMHNRGRRTGYAIAKLRGKTVYMHRIILQARSEEQVDHRDGDGLNNTRGNLRICTHSQNLANSVTCRRNTSGFKGVTFDRQAGKWKTQIKGKHVGFFLDLHEAADAYKRKAEEIYGEFARF